MKSTAEAELFPKMDAAEASYRNLPEEEDAFAVGDQMQGLIQMTPTHDGVLQRVDLTSQEQVTPLLDLIEEADRVA